MSPSNRIFHETGFARDPLYLVRGKELARVNLSHGSEWSAVFLAEVAPNGDAPFVAGEPFEPKGQAKLEWAAPSGRGWLGVTAGAGRRTRGFFGEYAAVTVHEGLSVYADAVHQAGTRAWYPVDLGPAGAIFRQDATSAGLRSLVLGGVRYSFVNGTDVRVEYVFDEAGWTGSELALASRAATASPALVPAWLAPGFELLGREHLYASVGLPDLPPGKRTKAQLRYLTSLTDHSGAAFATASYDATDSAVVFVSAIWTHGEDHGAVSRLVVAAATAGIVVSW
jgi:hypothetical protein